MDYSKMKSGMSDLHKKAKKNVLGDLKHTAEKAMMGKLPDGMKSELSSIRQSDDAGQEHSVKAIENMHNKMGNFANGDTPGHEFSENHPMVEGSAEEEAGESAPMEANEFDHLSHEELDKKMHHLMQAKMKKHNQMK